MISLIPLIGYVLLWGDWLKTFGELFPFQGKLGPEMWFSTSTRLRLVYFGSLIILLAWIMYIFRCPRFIKNHSEPEAFINQNMASHDPTYSDLLYDKIPELIGKQDKSDDFFWSNPAIIYGRVLGAEAVFRRRGPTWFHDDVKLDTSVILRSIYNLQDFSRLPARFSTLALLVIGTISFLLPSAEVFFLVLRSLVRW